MACDTTLFGNLDPLRWILRQSMVKNRNQKQMYIICIQYEIAALLNCYVTCAFAYLFHSTYNVCVCVCVGGGGGGGGGGGWGYIL